MNPLVKVNLPSSIYKMYDHNKETNFEDGQKKKKTDHCSAVALLYGYSLKKGHKKKANLIT